MFVRVRAHSLTCQVLASPDRPTVPASMCLAIFCPMLPLPPVMSSEPSLPAIPVRGGGPPRARAALRRTSRYSRMSPKLNLGSLYKDPKLVWGLGPCLGPCMLGFR